MRASLPVAALVACSALLALSGRPALAGDGAAPGGAAKTPDVDEPWVAAPFSAPAGEVAAAARRIPQPTDGDPDVELLLEQAHHVFAEDGTSVLTYRQVYRILTPAGLASWSVTRSPWSPWAERRPEVRARVISPDGAESVLDPTTLAEVPVASRIEQVWVDRKALEGPLPGVRVGSVIEEETVWRDKPPLIPGGTLRSWYLGGNAPVRRSMLHVRAPEAMNLRVRARGVEARVGVQTSDGQKVLRFEGGPYPSAPDPAQSLPYDAPRQARIVYSTGESWASIAQAYSELVDERLADADLSEIADAVRAAASGKTGRKATRAKQVAAALADVHRRVRYSGVHFGEAAILPADPTTTLGRGFGDCKDKSTLLVGVLRELGIDAHVALVKGAPGEDLLTDLPALGAFDHAIVRVADPPMWIDPTDPFAPAGVLPVPVMGRRTLIASADTEAPVLTPEPLSSANVKHEQVEFQLAPAGPPSAKVLLSMSGAFAQTYRRRLDTAGRASMTRALRAYAASGFGLGEAEGVIHEDYKPSLPQRIELGGDGSTFGFTGKDGAHVTIPDLGLFSDLPLQLRPGDPQAGSPREQPLRVAVPYTYRFVLTVRPGPGLADPILPPDHSLSWGPAKLVRKSTRDEDGAVTVDVTFDSGAPLVSAEDAEAIRQGAAEYAERTPLTVRFDKQGAVALAAGRYGEAIRVMRSVARAHPGIVELRAELISALLAGGYGDEARREARALVTRHPDSGFAHQMLGWTLQHDLLGRDLAPGMDHAGALEAFRRALALDPTNPLPMPSICGLLDRDPNGLRFTAAVDLRAAAECRLSLPRPLEDNYDSERTLQALAWAGRFDELIRQGDELPRTPLGDALRVAATVVTDGVEGAAAAAGRLVQSPDARRKLFDESRKALFRLGRYDDAVAWLDHVGGGPELARAERDRLRGLRRRPAETLAGSDDPADVWRAVTALWMSPSYDRGQVLDRFTPGLRARLRDPKQFGAVVGAWGGWAQTQPDADLVARVSRDLAMGAASPTQMKGDRRSGWTLELPEVAQDSPYVESYVVPTTRGPRIASVRGLVDSAGDEALARIRSGDKRVARGLLGWAAKVVGRAPATARHREFLVAMRLRGKGVPVEVAAALLAGPGSASAGEIVRATTSPVAGPDPLRKMVRRVRAAALMDLGRHTEVVELLPASPSDLSMEEAVLRIEALRRLGQGHRAVALSRQILARSDVSLPALRWAWDRAAAMGSFEESEALRDRVLTRARSTPVDLLTAAWRTQFSRRPHKFAASWARRGNEQLLDRAPDGLLVEAMLLASSRELHTARQRRDAARSQRPTGPVSPRLWLVQGRIAQQEGLTDMARSYYRRAMQAPAERADSEAALAARWLKGLGGPSASSP